MEVITMIIMILEATVTPERWDKLQIAYKKRIKELPIQIRQNFLIQGVDNPNTWRIISVWQSQEDYEAMKNSPVISTGADIFREAGVEPTRRIFKVIAQHMHV
jgi:heme-degrading monooxygenase HmoA